uniref:Uncharacterized protein n=1 Tax=Kalanchoe fedtschenkoi TaxID=63787 RepID=A0A7N0V7T2_KALFE
MKSFSPQQVQVQQTSSSKYFTLLLMAEFYIFEMLTPRYILLLTVDRLRLLSGNQEETRLGSTENFNSLHHLK